MSEWETVFFDAPFNFDEIRKQVEAVTGLVFERCDVDGGVQWIARTEPGLDVILEEDDFGPNSADARFGVSVVQVIFPDLSEDLTNQQREAQRIFATLSDKTNWSLWLDLSDADRLITRPGALSVS